MNTTTLKRITLIPVLATLFSSAAIANTSSQPNVLWHNSSTGAIKFMPVNGMTAEDTLPVVDSSNTNLLPKGMGDFTGDGQPDILFHNQNSGNLRIWEMDGSAKGENIQVLGSSNTNLQIAGVGDFDGDGDNDIATFNTNSGSLRMWVMDGTERVENILVLSGANVNLVPRGAGDMDGDGIPDIVLRNNNSGAVRVWTMNGDLTRKGNEYVTGSSNTNLELRGVVDIDNDGNNDILNYNTNTGKLRAWMMDGNLAITDNAEVIQDAALEWSVRGGVVSPPVLSGIAAAGAPIIGHVIVRGANGNRVTETIEADGSYDVDVSTLTAPYMLRAEGTVAGRNYEIHSFADSSNVGGTINITPFTDLIIANAAGELASSYFDSGDFSDMTPEAIDEQETRLQARLQSVLTALGVSDTIDLLTTSFDTDHSGLDAALDMINVEYNSETNMATLTNLIDSTTLEDNFVDDSQDEGGTIEVISDLGSAQSEIVAIETRITEFSTLLGSGSATVSALNGFISENFLDEDEGRDEFVSSISSEDLSGLELIRIVISDLSMDDSTAKVTFNVSVNGSTDAESEIWKMQKINGQWMILGNGQIVELYGDFHCNRNENVNGFPYGENGSCGANLNVEDNDMHNNYGAGAILSARVDVVRDGVVVPNTTVYLQESPYSPGRLSVFSNGHNNGNDWVGFDENFNYGAIQSGDQFRFQLYASELNVNDLYNPSVSGDIVDTYYEPIISAPVTTTAASDYPVVAEATKTALENFTGGSLTIDWTLPELATGVEIRYDAWDDNGNRVQVEDWNPSGNSVTFNVNFDSLDQNSIYQELRVYAHNEFGQEFSTFYRVDGATPAPLSLEALIVGQTKYFANSLGGTGYRNYADDGSYTGSVTLGDGTTFNTSGTYDILDNALIVNRTSPSATTLVLNYMGEEAGGLGFSITVDGGEAFETYSFATAVERDDARAAYLATLNPELSAFFVGQTKYFANSLGGTGYRNYADDGSYTGSVTLGDGTTFDTSGTYEILDNVLIVNRTSPSASALVLTYMGEEEGGLGFSITVDGGEVFETYSFATATERDDARAAYLATLNPDLPAFFVEQTKYFANSLGGTGHRNYDADGSYTGSVTLGDGTTFNTSGTYDISDNTLIVNRTSPSASTLVLTYMGEEEGTLGFSITVDGGEAFQTLSFATAEERDAYVAGLSSTDFETMLAGQTLYQVWYGGGQDANGNDIDNVAVVAKVTFNLDGTAEYVGLMNEGTGSGKWEVTNDKLVLVASADSFDYTEYNQYVSGDIASGCIQTNWINENDPNDNNIDLFFTDETVALNYATNLTEPAHCP